MDDFLQAFFEVCQVHASYNISAVGWNEILPPVGKVWMTGICIESYFSFTVYDL